MMQPVPGIRGVQGFRSVDLAAGIEPVNAVGSIGYARLPSDPVGTLTLTLQNLVVGSAIRVETTMGDAIAFRTAGSTTEVFTVPAFAVGSANNNLVIKVRKGSSAPFFQPFETQATAVVGSQSIFVSQIPDE